MRDHRSFRRALPAVALLLAAAPARAQNYLIYFLDGFTISGRVVEQKTLMTDSISKEAWVLPKGIYVDDGPRRFFFPPGLMKEADKATARREDAIGTGRPRVIIPEPRGVPVVVDILKDGPFNEKWDRTFLYRTTTYPVEVPQHLMELTPFHARADATKNFIWSAYYLTQELGYQRVRKLLADNPALRDSAAVPAETRAARRFRLYRFLVHAGWLNEASEELDAILRDLPQEKKKVEEERERLARLRAQRHFEDIERGHRAGRHQWVQKQIAEFREKYASQKAVDEVRALKRTHAENARKIEEARTRLAALLKEVRGEEETLFREAAGAIRAELHQDTVGRLTTFLEQARQAERQQKAKGKAEKTPSQLLAMAVTGWLQGDGSAEDRAETARKLWAARKMVLAYLQAETEAGRKRVLTDFASAKNAIGIDEVAQVISLLPPPLAEEKLPEGVVERKVDGVSYLLRLPPEYHPARPYPLLIVLHDANESPRKALDRFAEKAREEGYILAAPNWSGDGLGGGNYTFSADEHEVVLKTLRDLRLRFNVDSDRVFLFGLRQGGDMAFDVGLSHPDLFAGVLPMSANPRYFIVRYWANALYLPLYVVGGDHTGDPDRAIRKQLFEKWILHPGYATLYVQYKGRGPEWFGGELPYMFDWMNRKRRSTPITHLGRTGGELGDEFSSMRETDNRFYWVSGKIDPRLCNVAGHWRHDRYPATLVARLDPATNQIFINQRGYRQLTVWLARDAKVDFEKDLTVRINGRLSLARQKVRPSLKVLLDDFAARGDRQKLFIGRFDFNP